MKDDIDAEVSKVRVRRPRPDEWRRVKALRVEMLTDSPGAYAVTLADTLAQPDAHWQLRATPSLNPNSFTLIAESVVDGAWVGTAAAVQFPGHELPDLVGVYVAPTWRGQGVLDALLQPLEEWAAVCGGLRLLVQEANVRAQRAYASRGFVFTGYSEPHLLPPHGLDLEMVKTAPGDPAALLD